MASDRAVITSQLSIDVSAPPTPSLSFSNFRLNSMDSMSMSSLSMSFDSSPVLRDFQEMTLSLTSDDDEDVSESTPFANQISPSSADCQSHGLDDNSLFLFADDLDTTQNKKLLQTDDELPLSDNEEDMNPFLQGLALDIPCKMYDIDILSECEDEEQYSNNYFDDDDEDFEEYISSSDDLFDISQHDISADINRKFMMKKYKLIRNIGIGAFGIVDKVLNVKSNQYVAIKQSRCIGEEVLKQFRKETVILQEFTACEYIIDLMDYGRNVDANQICIGLEYMDIGSLCNMAAYTLNQIKYISKCVLMALQTLHEKLYVHNDIKPDNILISSAARVKVIDFGCTMQMKSITQPLTKSIGSIRYLSFEKRFKSPIQYTTKSDIYSFGITISELFNGEHIDKKSRYDHYFMTSSPTLTDATADNGELSDFISKCVDPQPDTRYSATQLLRHSFLSDVPQTVQFTMPSAQE